MDALNIVNHSATTEEADIYLVTFQQQRQKLWKEADIPELNFS